MLEYKENLSASFARELVALSNTAGGKILIEERWSGLFGQETGVYKRETALGS